MRASRRLRSVITGAAVTAAAVSSLALATPATAVGGCVIAGGTPFGATVGMPTVVNVEACNGQTQLVATFAGNITQAVQIGFTGGNAGTATWIPQQSGPATLSLTDNAGGASTGVLNSATVASTPTTTVVSAPNTATTGQSTVINVLVTSAGTSQYVPTGSVRLNTGFGVNITTMGLTPSFNTAGTMNPQAPAGATPNSAFAFYRWTPPNDGTFTFQSVYSGDTNATTSTSQIDSLLATPTGGTIALHAPNTATVGVPVAMTANIFPTTSVGSAGFTINGQAISASVPFVNGVAAFTWTPTTAGNLTLGVSYMTNDGRSGNTAQPITVVAGPGASDQITLIQPGFGPWAPNGVYTLPMGTSITFQTSTLSGAAVTLSDTGPCNLSGNTLVVDVAQGQCNLIATSPGGPGYAPVKFGYTVLPAPGNQTAALAAPATGSSLQRGRTVRLETAAQGQTNAGQVINWTVLKNSRSICRLRFASSGAVNLQLQKAGTCNVRATAPAVPNQWNAYRLDLRYRVR